MIRMFKSSGVSLSDHTIAPIIKADSNKRRSRPWQIRKIPPPFRLSLEDINYLTRNTHYDTEEIKSWHKGFTKDCPDGLLRRDQILEMCSKILPMPKGNAEAFVGQIFRIFDRDGSGALDFMEFMVATDMAKAGTPEEKLRCAFKIYDIDSSGSIDITEMAEAIKTLYLMEGMDQKEGAFLRKAKRLFKVLDSDGDGELSLEEFVAGCMNDGELMKMLTAPSGQEEDDGEEDEEEEEESGDVQREEVGTKI